MTTTRTIAVIGATGTIGRAVIDRLTTEPGISILAATRQPDHPRCTTSQLTQVAFDWDAPENVDDVVAGADVVLVVPPGGHHPLPTTSVVVEAAARATAEHVVFISTFGAEFQPGFAFGRWALSAEQVLADSEMPHTVLRPNSFMSNFVTTRRPGEDGGLRLPWGTGATSFVDPSDIATVAVRVVLEPHPHDGATYELTGPEALDGHDLAAVLSETTGTPARFLDMPLEAVRAGMDRAGMPAPLVTAFIELHAVMASGARARVTGDVERVTGRPPRSFREFMTAHLARTRGHAIAGGRRG